jgi:hypothetical protein
LIYPIFYYNLLVELDFTAVLMSIREKLDSLTLPLDQNQQIMYIPKQK